MCNISTSKLQYGDILNICTRKSRKVLLGFDELRVVSDFVVFQGYTLCTYHHSLVAITYCHFIAFTIFCCYCNLRKCVVFRKFYLQLAVAPFQIQCLGNSDVMYPREPLGSKPRYQRKYPGNKQRCHKQMNHNIKILWYRLKVH